MSTQEKESIVHMIIQGTLPKSITVQEIQESTRGDPELIKLISYVQQEKLQM